MRALRRCLITPPRQWAPTSIGSGNNIHPDDLERVISGIRTVMDKGEQFWSGEYQFRRADGSYADVFDRGYVLYGESGSPTRMIGAMADISERVQAFEILEQRVATRTAELQEKNDQLEGEIAQRKRVEELLRTKNQDLKSFAYTVSHDLKAPLRGIAGYAQELDRRHKAGLSDRALFCLKQILVATNNLDRLIEDLLNYSRLDAAMPSDNDVDLRRLVRDILAERRQVISDQWRRSGCRSSHSASPNLGARSPADPHQSDRQCSEIQPRLHAAAIGNNQPHARRKVQITVSDNGIGFDMKYHDRIFGLFNRLVRQEEFEGTGAGLAIVKKLVEKLGGRIWAEATPGSGAKFFVDLPVRSGSSDAGSI